jgi:hypothetical protein
MNLTFFFFFQNFAFLVVELLNSSPQTEFTQLSLERWNIFFSLWLFSRAFGKSLMISLIRLKFASSLIGHWLHEWRSRVTFTGHFPFAMPFPRKKCLKYVCVVSKKLGLLKRGGMKLSLGWLERWVMMSERCKRGGLRFHLRVPR